jgi:hypothetical protein
MLKTFGLFHGDLGREAFPSRENWGAGHSGESGFDEHLSAHNDEDPVRLGVAVRFVHPVKVSAFHIISALIFCRLIIEHVSCLGVQLVGRLINQLQVACMSHGANSLSQIASQDALNECGSRTLWSSQLVDPS